MPTPLKLPVPVSIVPIARRILSDPQPGGVHPGVGFQIFFNDRYTEEATYTEHLTNLCWWVIAGRASEQNYVRTMSGLLQQAARAGKVPARWHIEYLTGEPARWLLRYPDRLDDRVRVFTECRVVVDEWANP